MSYAVVLASDVQKALRYLPTETVETFLTWLDDAAADPIANGRSIPLPNQKRGIIFEFCFEAAGTSWFITAHYHFLPGEESLRVYAVSAREF